VFALHTTRQGKPYDPVDITSWKFRVIAHRELLRSGKTSAGIGFFDKLGIEPVGYDELRDAVKHAKLINEQAERPAHPAWETSAGDR
jgi:hypothetical protein